MFLNCSKKLLNLQLKNTNSFRCYSNIHNNAHSKRFYSSRDRNFEESINENGFSHLDQEGKAKMVDVSSKSQSVRTAEAYAQVILGTKAFNLLKDQTLAKGDALSVSELAGILGAKKTSELLPLCHQINLTSVKCKLKLNPKDLGVDIYCQAKTVATTGVEMEALVGASVAALNVYDMCKAVTHEIVIREVKLLMKTGGKRDYVNSSTVND